MSFSCADVFIGGEDFAGLRGGCYKTTQMLIRVLRGLVVHGIRGVFWMGLALHWGERAGQLVN